MLFRTIRKDQRHSSVILVYDQPIEKRSFKGWAMAFVNINQIDKSQLKVFSEFL
ncbi:MAG: hypothetical protein DRZ76_00200 [Candidatus Nealsonbacteria bacterium]|nr:MAG: hypothetical protein DRZ76_00200 [Candidatus Nealsonbacteria bacterium]